MLSHKKGQKASASSVRSLVAIMPLRVVQVFRSQVEPMLQLVKAEEVACRAQEVQQERAFELDVHQYKLGRLKQLLSSLTPGTKAHQKRQSELSALTDAMEKDKAALSMASEELSLAQARLESLRKGYDQQAQLLAGLLAENGDGRSPPQEEEEEPTHGDDGDGQQPEEEEEEGGEAGGGEEEAEDEVLLDTSVFDDDDGDARHSPPAVEVVGQKRGRSPPSSSCCSGGVSSSWSLVLDKSDVLGHVLSFVSDPLLPGLGSVSKACRAGVQGTIREVRVKCGPSSWSGCLPCFPRLQSLHIVGALQSDGEAWSLTRFLHLRLPEIAATVVPRVTCLSVRSRRANSEKKALSVMAELLKVRWSRLKAIKLESWMYRLLLTMSGRAPVSSAFPCLEAVGGWGRRALEPLAEACRLGLVGQWGVKALHGRGTWWRISSEEEAAHAAALLRALPLTQEVSLVEFSPACLMLHHLGEVLAAPSCLTNLRQLVLEPRSPDSVTLLLSALSSPSCSASASLQSLTLRLRHPTPCPPPSPALRLPRLQALSLRIKGSIPRYGAAYPPTEEWPCPLLPLLQASPALESVEVVVLGGGTLEAETVETWQRALALPQLRRLRMLCPCGPWVRHLLLSLSSCSSPARLSLQDLELSLGDQSDDALMLDPIQLPRDMLPNLRRLVVLGRQSACCASELLLCCGPHLQQLEVTGLPATITTLHRRSQLWPLHWLSSLRSLTITRPKDDDSALYIDTSPPPPAEVVAGVLASLKSIETIDIQLPMTDEFVVRLLRLLLSKGRPARLWRLELNWELISRGGVLLLAAMLLPTNRQRDDGLPRGLHVVGLAQRVKDWSLTGGE